MERQYVEVSFNLMSTEVFTYHNDGTPVKVADDVFVPSRYAGIKRIATVVGVGASSKELFNFETKSILGLAPPREGATA